MCRALCWDLHTEQSRQNHCCGGVARQKENTRNYQMNTLYNCTMCSEGKAERACAGYNRGACLGLVGKVQRLNKRISQGETAVDEDNLRKSPSETRLELSWKRK